MHDKDRSSTETVTPGLQSERPPRPTQPGPALAGKSTFPGSRQIFNWTASLFEDKVLIELLEFLGKPGVTTEVRPFGLVPAELALTLACLHPLQTRTMLMDLLAKRMSSLQTPPPEPAVRCATEAGYGPETDRSLLDRSRPCLRRRARIAAFVFFNYDRPTSLTADSCCLDATGRPYVGRRASERGGAASARAPRQDLTDSALSALGPPVRRRQLLCRPERAPL